MPCAARGGRAALPAWTERAERLLTLSRRQLFFVGGAPRSGTTWLQYLLDAHPEVCCAGEGLFRTELAEPMDKLIAARRTALAVKNESIFRHSGGYPLPDAGDTEALVATGILLALERQCGGADYRAVGEKTPENVFFFPVLKRLFPDAKFIGIARDPRDVASSAWHFFRKPKDGDDPVRKIEFVQTVLPALQQGMRTLLELRRNAPADCMLVTYERMLGETEAAAAALYRFLGVSDDHAVVADCVARTSFAALTHGRKAGTTEENSFFRKGVVGDWRATLTEATGEMIVRELGWCFPEFGWVP
jgi:hypothetical protein